MPAPPPTRVPAPPTPLHDGILGVLNHPVRVDILERLSRRSESVSQIAEALDLSIDNVTYHLRLLWEEKLIWFERDRQSHIYHLSSAVRFDRTETKLTAALLYDDETELSVEVRRLRSAG